MRNTNNRDMDRAKVLVVALGCGMVLAGVPACGAGGDSNIRTTFDPNGEGETGDPGDGDPGDGDGDPGDGDGDPGDGDGDPGDGDGDPGDGDGDPGDGDGDGDPGDGDGDPGDGDGDSMPECGNGIVEGDEACDDGNPKDTDACTNACLDAVCGDGIVHIGVEECDDGNVANDDACVDSCSFNYCGDGFVWPDMEACDDGNMSDADACTNACIEAACGDGIVWDGVEGCDDGNGDDDDACLTSCEGAQCGDGIVWSGQEDCDDGNQVDDDLCTNECVSNGVVYTGNFTQNVPSTQQQCNEWNAFRNQLNGYQFSSVTIDGSLDLIGRTCDDPELADQICQALASGQNTTVMCQGNEWNVTGQGGCSAGQMELSADGDTCSCASEYVVRPCILFEDWGGVNSFSCFPPTQTIRVTCE